jgi:hypothetical protein
MVPYCTIFNINLFLHLLKIRFPFSRTPYYHVGSLYPVGTIYQHDTTQAIPTTSADSIKYFTSTSYTLSSRTCMTATYHIVPSPSYKSSLSETVDILSCTTVQHVYLHHSRFIMNIFDLSATLSKTGTFDKCKFLASQTDNK